MRAMKGMKVVQRVVRRPSPAGKHELMFRRAANHNVHVITPHGNIFTGRKGRKG